MKLPLWRRKQKDELDEELRAHHDAAVRERVERGQSRTDAEAAARREFGNAGLVAEVTRDMWGWASLDRLAQDVRYGLRQLRRNPGFTVTAVLTLALGIGATTAIFSAVYPILFASLPYPQAHRLAVAWEQRKDGGRIESTFGAYRAFVERCRLFETLAVVKAWQPTLVGEARPERLEGQRTSASYFRVLGVSPMLGRDFLEEEDVLNGPNVAIISEGLWQRRFGGDREIIGRSLRLDGNIFTVVGVAPRAAESALPPATEIWAPLQYDQSLPPQGREWGRHLRLVGRLRPGATLEHAGVELAQILRDLAAIDPARLRNYGAPERFMVSSLQDDVTSAVKPALLAVLGAVGLMLMIACVNVVNLCVARGAQRRGEYAVRAALGAGRLRLMRQVLTESLVLALCGGVAGALVAALGVDALRALRPPGLPRVEAIGMNGVVILFALTVATLTGLLVGLIPALRASRGDLHRGLQHSGSRVAGSEQGTRRALAVAEVALALVLLVGTGLLLRSLQHLLAVSPGFDAANLLTMQVQVAGHRFDDAATARFFDQALEAIRQTPGVTAAGFTSQLPLSGELDEYGAQFEPVPGGSPESSYSSFRYVVSPGYLEAMGIPLRRGRWLDSRDGAGAPPVVVISESLAKASFATLEVIGKRVHIGRRDLPWFTVVGVVGDVKQASLMATRSEAAYITPAQWYFADRAVSFVVRAAGDASQLAPAVRQAIWSIDKDQPIVRVATMENLLLATASERRFALVLFEAFGLNALALAAVGIYGVLSGSVSERTREIGVRLALGADPRRILTWTLRQGMLLAGLGVALGLAGAAAASRLLASLLYAVSPLDVVTYLGVAALLTVVSGVACWLPARRASRVDPAIALRYE